MSPTDKYALWLDFRMINENTLHGTSRKIGSAVEGIILQIEKKAEMAGVLTGHIYMSIYHSHFFHGWSAEPSEWRVCFYYTLTNADDPRTPYSAVCGSYWGWKNTFSLAFT